MLRFSDTRNFSRTLAAIGLIAGPSSSPSSRCSTRRGPATAPSTSPRWRTTRAATSLPGVGTIGSLVFIPGLLGVMRLFRRRSVSLGQIAAGLLTSA